MCVQKNKEKVHRIFGDPKKIAGSGEGETQRSVFFSMKGER